MKFDVCRIGEKSRTQPTDAITLAIHLGLALLISLCSGCGKKGPEFGQVEGTVRVNGQPHEKFVVRFMPDPAKGNNLSFNGMGITDAQGKYRLHHIEKGQEVPGVPVGWNRVVIEDASHGPTPQGQTPPPPLVPFDYSSPSSTPLSKEVKPGTQTIDLDIK